MFNCLGICETYLIIEGDTEDVKQVKKTAVKLILMVCCMTLMPTLFYGGNLYVFSGSVLGLGGSILMLLYIFITRTAPLYLLDGYVGLLLISLIVIDSELLVLGEYRVWSVAILILDTCLLLRLHTFVSLGIVSAMLLWLAISALEKTYRIGIAQLPGMPSESERANSLKCLQFGDTFPCKKSFLSSSAMFVGYSFTFLIDYYLTRGFANNVKQQQANTQQCIDITSCIATSLYNFDLDAARHSLKQATMMPEGLHIALEGLLNNLTLYRPYLPQSCFPMVVDEVDGLNRSNSFHPTGLLNTSIRTNSTADDVTDVIIPKKLCRYINITVSVINVQGSLTLIKENSKHFAENFCSLVDAAVTRSKENRGILDIILGDHIMLSYNAVKGCSTHTTASVNTCVAVIQDMKTSELKINSSCASSFAVVGDLGNGENRRFCTMGEVSVFIYGIERVGRDLGIPLLTCSRVRSDAGIVHDTRLIPKKFKFYRESFNNTDGVVLLWEIIFTDSASTPTMPSREEWMYELTKQNKDNWEPYNRAVKTFLIYNDPQGATEILSNLEDSNSTLLLEDINSHNPPPISFIY